MHEAAITIKKIWPPFKPTDARTNLEDMSGRKWRALREVLPGFSEGEEVLIEYTAEEYPPGNKYDLIKSMKPANGSSATPAGRGATGTGSYAGGTSNGRQMFVCAIVKEWVGKIPVAETTTLISAIISAMDAYDQTFGNE